MQMHIQIQKDKQTHMEIIIEGAILELLGGPALIKVGWRSQSLELEDISQSSWILSWRTSIKLAEYYLKFIAITFKPHQSSLSRVEKVLTSKGVTLTAKKRNFFQSICSLTAFD